VAGTNGKGSTCAMLEAILLQAGYRTGVYTSPHLVHFEERCRIHGEIATGGDLIPHFERVEQAAGRGLADLFRIHHAGHPEPHGGVRSGCGRSWRWAWAGGWMR
jgi:folylpolyglutamate synthase/dihydropteroate synthase